MLLIILQYLVVAHHSLVDLKRVLIHCSPSKLWVNSGIKHLRIQDGHFKKFPLGMIYLNQNLLSSKAVALCKHDCTGRCLRVPCREATREELVACHTEHLVSRVEDMASAAEYSGRELGTDRVYFTQDTYVRPNTYRCASLAAGGCIEVATAVAR